MNMTGIRKIKIRTTNGENTVPVYKYIYKIQSECTIMDEMRDNNHTSAEPQLKGNGSET